MKKQIHIPNAFEKLFKSYRKKIYYGGRGCYPEDTEVLTPDGWIQIKDYKKEKILIYDKDSTNAVFDSNVGFVKLPIDRFIQIKNKKTDFTTSINHTHLLRNNKTLKIETKKTYELLEKHQKLVRGVKSQLIRTFTYNGTGIDYTDNYIKLKIAVIADGHFPKKGKYGNCRVNLKRERKIKRLKELLKVNAVKYRCVVNSNGFSVFTFLMDNTEKEFENYWYKANSKQLNIITKEVLLWDGSIFKRDKRVDVLKVTSVSKRTADFVQFAFHSVGRKADIETYYNEKYKQGVIYNITISKYFTETSISKDHKSKSTVSFNECDNTGFMYCFTTRTGFFIVRQKNRIYVSGNSAKSESFGRALLIQASNDKHRILCCREIQNSIKDSVHRLLWDIIEDYNLPDYYVTRESIRNTKTGSEFLFKGLKSNVQEIKSMKGITRCWVEEAHSVSYESWRILIPTIREPNSEIWASFNRYLEDDPVWDLYCKVPQKDTLVQLVNYCDNPFFPDVLDKERLADKENDLEYYMHVWEGEPIAQTEKAIINRLEVLKAFERVIPDNDGQTVIGVDVAREGKDRSVIFKRRGLKLVDFKIIPMNKLDELENMVVKMTDTRNDYINIDKVGLGAYLPDYLKKRGFRNATGVANSQRPKDTRQYEDSITEQFFDFKKILPTVDLSMITNPKMKSDIIGQLCNREYDITSKQKLKVESKEKFKKRYLKSPDEADSLLLTYFTPKRPPVDMTFSGLSKKSVVSGI